MPTLQQGHGSFPQKPVAPSPSAHLSAVQIWCHSSTRKLFFVLPQRWSSIKSQETHPHGQRCDLCAESPCFRGITAQRWEPSPSLFKKSFAGVWRQHFCGLAGGQQLKIKWEFSLPSWGVLAARFLPVSLEMELERRKQGEGSWWVSLNWTCHTPGQKVPCSVFSEPVLACLGNPEECMLAISQWNNNFLSKHVEIPGSQELQLAYY